MEISWLSIAIFASIIILLLALDLGVFNRKDHKISNKEALLWSVVWIGLGLAFGHYLKIAHSPERATEYYTAFLIEKALSMDNLFIFIVVFNFFQIPDKYQHRVLFWGIMGAIVFRAILIFAGVGLIKVTYLPAFDLGPLHIDEFNVLLFLFGIFLLFTGLKTFKKPSHEKPDVESHIAVRILKRFMPVYPHLEGNKFVVKRDGKRTATLLLLALVVIEFSDILFALDSIPAIFTISQDPVVLYTSNIFAILGLRSLYFLLANSMHMFAYLRYGLAFILTFIGIKMLAAPFYHVQPMISLVVIGCILFLSIAISLLERRMKQ